MERLKFLFGVHCHQPEGNFDFVFEKAFKKAYLPFFEILKEYPEIKLVAHISGCLLDWIEKKQPYFLDLIKDLISKGQVEILGGGYYEPILPILPEKDQINQLYLMKKKLHNFFGVNPEGAWIAERVWEPNLPAVLSKTGYKAVFLDDFHFLSSGLKDEEIFDFFETYHLNHKVYLFPIKEKYRYLIPFAPVEEVLENFLKDSKIYNGSILTMVDDGEKFGIWPGTYKWVWEEKWLFKFFEALKKADFVKTITLKEALFEKKIRGILHIPTQSYFEMGEWTLPTEKTLKYKELYEEIKFRQDLKPFLKGGYWRNFFEKYEESFWIYQRMLIVSNYLKNKKNDYLLKAQCNCGWWHGIFGGLYLPFLRRAIFTNLIKAEKNKKIMLYKEGEFLVLRDKYYQIFLSEKYGGIIKELDILKYNLNITDLLKRRIEAYHFEQKGEKKEHSSIHNLSFSIDESFRKDIINDSYTRNLLILHFFENIPENLNEVENYDLIKIWKESAKITKKGKDLIIKSKKDNIEATKKISIFEKILSINITNKGEIPKYWGVEIPISLPDGFYKTINNEYKNFSFSSIFKDEEELFLWDKVTGLKIKINFGEKSLLNVFPLNTIAKCESGFEKILQGIIILPIYNKRNANINIFLEE